MHTPRILASIFCAVCRARDGTERVTCADVSSAYRWSKKRGAAGFKLGTGTMGGIEGARAMEKAFNKAYGLNLPFKYSPGRPCRSLPAASYKKAEPANRRPAIS
jgi:hypothetical protein